MLALQACLLLLLEELPYFWSRFELTVPGGIPVRTKGQSVELSVVWADPRGYGKSVLEGLDQLILRWASEGVAAGAGVLVFLLPLPCHFFLQHIGLASQLQPPLSPVHKGPLCRPICACFHPKHPKCQHKHHCHNNTNDHFFFILK